MVICDKFLMNGDMINNELIPWFPCVFSVVSHLFNGFQINEQTYMVMFVCRMSFFKRVKDWTASELEALVLVILS